MVMDNNKEEEEEEKESYVNMLHYLMENCFIILALFEFFI